MRQQGNILFLILIAVALFAALSYAVTSSSRTGSEAISKEQADLAASHLLQYATQIEQGVNKMILFNNSKDYALDLFRGDVTVSNPTTACTSDLCNLYAAEGGGVPAVRMPADYYNPDAPFGYDESRRGKMFFRTTAIVGVGSDANDLSVAWLGIRPEICRAINRRMGISNPDDIDTVDANSGNYGGVYTEFPANASAIGDVLTKVQGKRSFCYKYDNTNYLYAFSHVIIAR